jgi:hypothetical protein
MKVGKVPRDGTRAKVVPILITVGPIENKHCTVNYVAHQTAR